jgi:hypothetical protein
MIITELYNGQGLGNQLWCYFVTRVVAEEKNYDFGIMSTEKFKGKEFMSLDFGNEVIGGFEPEGGSPKMLPNGIVNYYKEKITRRPNGIDITKYDDGVFSISDNTKLEGNLQSSYYIEPHREKIKKWVNIKKEFDCSKYSDDDVCIIHIRGGDYLGSSAYLNESYYRNAIKVMTDKNPNMKFYIVTDDVNYSKKLLPEKEIIGGSSMNFLDVNKANHHIGGPIWVDWILLNNCRNVIISASSFSFWPVWLNDDVFVIAPMFWGDHKNSDGYWSGGDLLIKDWNYISKEGILKNYNECLTLKEEYEKNNKNLWKN